EAPLALGVQRIDRQAALAGARNAGDDHDLARRELEVHALQVVRASSAERGREHGDATPLSAKSPKGNRPPSIRRKRACGTAPLGLLAPPPMARASGGQKKELGGDRLVSKNRRAYFDFEVGDTIEAGLVLIGSEVRSLRENGADLSDAWVDLNRRGEAWIQGMRIPPLKHAAFGHEERRPRKLLLHMQQIDRLRGAAERDGMTIIATKCYFKSG